MSVGGNMLKKKKKKRRRKKKRWPGWIFLPGKAAHMECSQPATLCCYCCCFFFFFFVLLLCLGFFPFLSPVGYKTGCSFPAIVESCDGPPVASIASVRSPAQVNESRRNSQKFLQRREREEKVGEWERI